ncbi:hypothetical protein HXY33_05810 [Candidatus Bathyarchaeota archaeon]|nr:hypothetical protein [Candidatus Bathyarchaeota archaeon]
MKVVLAEYHALRGEIVRFGERQLQLFHILLLALSFAYGYLITYGMYDILCILPMLVSPFIFRYIWDQYNSTLISKYLKEEIAAKMITSLVGYKSKESSNEYERYWLGWQHYWDAVGAQPMQMRILGWYNKHVALLWIILISFVPSIIYSMLLVVSSYSSIAIQSSVPIYFHALLLIGYMWLLLKVLTDKRLKVT